MLINKRTLRRICLVICAASMLASCGKDSSSAENEKTYEECESAQTAVNNIGAGWNLGNTLDSTSDGLDPDDIWAFETSWGNPYTTKEMITAVKDAGFNAVRVPVTWQYHFDENGKIDKEWLDRVQEVVDYVYSQDMYVILNVHHDGGENGWVCASMDSYNENGEKFGKIWEQIAERFKDYDQKLMFEAINEILDPNNNWGGGKSGDPVEGLKNYNQKFVDTVRKGGGYNATRNLIIMTYAGGYDKIKALEIPTDPAKDHMLLEVHDYDPQGFCWKNATWTTMTDEWGSDEDKKAIDSSMDRIAADAKEKGLPVIIGEWGSQDKKGNEDARAVHAGYFAKAAWDRGIKCFWWDCGDFAIIDRDLCQKKCPKIVDAIIENSK